MMTQATKAPRKKRKTIADHIDENGKLKKAVSGHRLSDAKQKRTIATLGENVESLSCANEKLRKENAELQKANAKPKALDKLELSALLGMAVAKLRRSHFIKRGVNSRHILSLANSAHSMAVKSESE